MLMFDYQNYYASRFVGVSNECDPSTYPVESTVCPLDKEAASVMFPVNPETGNVVDLLTRLMRTENQLERSQILSLLSDNGADSPFAKLDDETKLSLLKPRSLQSFDEIASFRADYGFTSTSLKVDPRIFNPVVSVVYDGSDKTDQFIIDCSTACRAIRPIS